MAGSLGRESIVAWAEGAPAARDGAGAAFTPADEKFRVEGLIGRGGMGEVHLVTDEDLKRQIAMKVMREDVGQDKGHRLSFVAEAQATSQLEHPGIPPVHDIGLTPDGRLYFTMKLVQGRTLAEVILDLMLKRRDVQKEYNLHKLVSILEQICETMHFAHERGVIHRDLKPENVMLGDYGEVHVMDWGLARVEVETDPDIEGAEFVETARVSSGTETQHGEIKGTPMYMAPEQFRGDSSVLDARSDVYALGCLLYEMLTLHPAFDGSLSELISKKMSGDVVDVATRNPRRNPPESVSEVCRKAMATDPDERYATTRDMGAALRSWLDGRGERARRHREAEALAANGREALAQFERLSRDVTEAEYAVDDESTKVKAWQPVSEKDALLDARERVETLQTDVALAFAETTHLLNAALTQEPGNASARGALAELWKSRLADAERRQDAADAAHALASLERYDDGQFAAFVQGDGALSLSSEPVGAEVFLTRLEDQRGLLVAGEERSIGTTPLVSVPLPMGSYLCTLIKDGVADTRYPVHISRGRHWECAVRLHTQDEIGDEFVYVPGGPMIYGEGKGTKTIEVGDFAIQRLPVTFGDYLEFVAAVEAEEGLEAATARAPQTPGDGPYAERGEDGVWEPLPVIVEGDFRAFCLEVYGEGFERDIPVMGVSFGDAEAYCAWRTKTSGTTWRLPTEEEREKVARGVDGRRFPWGELEDASLVKCRDSRPESAQPEPVGAFEAAVSVYGMVDAAGGTWDWTNSWFDGREALRVLRGGSWSDPPANLRCANRVGYQPSLRSASGGFRCARGL